MLDWQVELNNLLKHLKFCADELEALQHKQENMQELGMEGVSGDIITAKHKIQDKYLETESQVGYPYVCHMLFQGSFAVFLLRF
jgi:hypothetical protein